MEGLAHPLEGLVPRSHHESLAVLVTQLELFRKLRPIARLVPRQFRRTQDAFRPALRLQEDEEQAPEVANQQVGGTLFSLMLALSARLHAMTCWIAQPRAKTAATTTPNARTTTGSTMKTSIKSLDSTSEPRSLSCVAAILSRDGVLGGIDCVAAS